MTYMLFNIDFIVTGISYFTVNNIFDLYISNKHRKKLSIKEIWFRNQVQFIMDISLLVK